MLVVISNMLKRYSFQIPVLYVQQLYSCCYLERLLIIGLILSCRCYCFYYRSNWFNRLLLLCDLFLVVLLLFVDVIGSMFQFQILCSLYDCLLLIYLCGTMISGSNLFVQWANLLFRTICFPIYPSISRCQSALEWWFPIPIRSDPNLI